MKYKLKKWYPSLHKWIKEGDVVKYLKHTKPYPSYMHNTGKTIDKYEVERNPEFWEPVVDKDYEILSLSNESGYIITFSKSPFDQSCLKVLLSNDIEIHSVKRLSDGEVFTVGDWVKTCNSDKPKKIKGFELDQNSIRFRFEDGLGVLLKYFRNPDDIKHAKQPLFTTEDGIDIFEGDRYCFIIPDNTICYVSNAEFGSGSAKSYKYFSTKEKAEEWIEYNKPQYSKSDIIKAIKKSYADLCGLKDFDVIDKKEFKKRLDL